MSIWAEIKKAINSNLNLPLNEKIDRDIEENRIGLGYMTSSEAKLNGTRSNLKLSEVRISTELNVAHIVLFRGMLYILGACDSTSSKLFLKCEPGGTPTSAGNLPISLLRGTTFVYHDELYIMKTTYFYKYDGTQWIKLTAGVSDFTEGHSYVYKDKVYVTDHKRSKVYVYNGLSWTTINTTEPLSSFFEKDGKLYSLSVSKTFYYLEENTTKFVVDTNFSNDGIEIDFGNNIGYIKTAVGTTGKIHLMFNNASYVYDDAHNKWISGSPSPCQSMYSSNYAVHEGVLYLTHAAGGSYYCRKSLNVILDIDYFLPKNTNIVMEDKELYTIVPINNCEVMDDNTIRVLEDGKITFRLIEAYQLGRVLFK